MTKHFVMTCESLICVAITYRLHSPETYIIYIYFDAIIGYWVYVTQHLFEH